MAHAARSTSSISKKAAWLIPATGIAALLAFGQDLTPWQKLAGASAGLLLLMKLAILIKEGAPQGAGLAWYLTIWPGMDPKPLAVKGEPRDRAAPRFVKGLLTFIGGVMAILALSLAAPQIPRLWLGWLGLAACLLVIHAGLAGMITGITWLTGYKTRPLFDSPMIARSLKDFWTRRWNIPFVEMDRILFMPTLTRWFGLTGGVFAVFLVSGLLHEFAISYPAGAGWGYPFLYFVIQAFAIVIESKLRLRSRLLTWLVVLGPMPILFHDAFRSVFIEPLFLDAHRLLVGQSVEWYLDKGLWLLGILQLSVLIASFQVPGKLKWKEEMVRLSPFNRKLMWTQGVFIVLTIIAFSVLTLALHDEMLRGDRAAIAVATFAAAFWSLRLLVDAVVYKHTDWPAGPQFIIGHALLNCLFVLLALGYGSLVLWHQVLKA